MLYAMSRTRSVAWLVVCSLFGLCDATLIAGPPKKIDRDWNKYPAVVQVDTERDVYVVGDPHADYERLVTLLTGTGIASGSTSDKPKDVPWSAGKSVVVFTGDYIDKGTESLPVIELVQSLQRAAAAEGGQAIILMGNHEAEFLADWQSDKVAEFRNELTKDGLVPADVAACKGDLGEFLCSLPFAARVNDAFLCHAGNTQGRTIKKLISDLENGVDSDGFATEELIGADSLLEARLGEDKNPWIGADPKKTLTAYTSALGVAHIVQGHQPGKVKFPGKLNGEKVRRDKGEMFQRYGLIFLEDTGMSRGIGDDGAGYSQGAVLRIPASSTRKAVEAIAICYDGKAATIWDSGKNSEIGRIPPCGK